MELWTKIALKYFNGRTNSDANIICFVNYRQAVEVTIYIRCLFTDILFDIKFIFVHITINL